MRPDLGMPVLLPDRRILIRGVDIDLPPLVRPSHWLPHEPLVTGMEPSGNFFEVTLEFGGRIVATRVVSDQDSCNMAIRDFKNIIDRACTPGAK